MGRAVNPLALPTMVQIHPSPPVSYIVYRMSYIAKQSRKGRIIEFILGLPRLPSAGVAMTDEESQFVLLCNEKSCCFITIYNILYTKYEFIAHVAQEVEHILGKDEVTGSSPVVGSQFIVYGIS